MRIQPIPREVIILEDSRGRYIRYLKGCDCRDDFLQYVSLKVSTIQCILQSEMDPFLTKTSNTKCCHLVSASLLYSTSI